nr:uncharacterized protein LOC131775749 [Pocillopora verrucosa]
MGVNGGPEVWRRVREACTRRTWPWSRSTSLREGKGTVIFASIHEDLTFAYRPNLSVRDVCTEAAQILKISPVALDFFTLVSVDSRHFLNPNKVLNEAECTSQVYSFRLCIKACHGLELRDIDKKAFEYYFHQCRRDFLSGAIGRFDNPKDFAVLVIYEIIYRARQPKSPVHPKVVIEHP